MFQQMLNKHRFATAFSIAQEIHESGFVGERALTLEDAASIAAERTHLDSESADLLKVLLANCLEDQEAWALLVLEHSNYKKVNK